MSGAYCMLGIMPWTGAVNSSHSEDDPLPSHTSIHWQNLPTMSDTYWPRCYLFRASYFMSAKYFITAIKNFKDSVSQVVSKVLRSYRPV